MEWGKEADLEDGRSGSKGLGADVEFCFFRGGSREVEDGEEVGEEAEKEDRENG